jgi:predicted Zn-dependent peptidase
VTFGIQVAAGLRDEPEERGGLTNLLSDMMFQGTETRDVRQLTDEFEEIGARRGAETGTEFARYSAQIVGARLEKALELFADILLHPAFPEEEFEQMRAIQLQEIRRRDDEPMRRIFDLVREKFYAGTSLGRRALGTKESVEELEPLHLLNFWRARYHAQRSLLSIAGNFDWNEVVALVEKYLGGWKGAAAPSPVETPHPQDAVNIELQDGNQEHIGMAYPFPKYGDPDYYAASVITEMGMIRPSKHHARASAPMRAALLSPRITSSLLSCTLARSSSSAVTPSDCMARISSSVTCTVSCAFSGVVPA